MTKKSARKPRVRSASAETSPLIDRNERRNRRAPATPPVERAEPDPLEAALDVAARIAEPYPEELEAIENVIRFVRGHRCGRPEDVRLSDVLLALSILLTAIDRELTPEERETFAMLDALLGVPARACAACMPRSDMRRAPGAVAPPHRRPPPGSNARPSTSPIPHIRFAA